MTQETIQFKILSEIKLRSIQIETPVTTDHYIPLRIFEQYVNMIYGAGFDAGRRSLNNRRPIEQLKDGKVIKVWNSQVEASRALESDNRFINRCVRGKKKQFKGFEWRYKIEAV